MTHQSKTLSHQPTSLWRKLMYTPATLFEIQTNGWPKKKNKVSDYNVNIIVTSKMRLDFVCLVNIVGICVLDRWWFYSLIYWRPLFLYYFWYRTVVVFFCFLFTLCYRRDVAWVVLVDFCGLLVVGWSLFEYKKKKTDYYLQ